MKASQVAFLVELFGLLRVASADDPSQLVWRAYGSIVNAALLGGAAPRPGIDYVFVTPPTVNTLQGGSPVPDALTNAGLYSLADTMQIPDAPIFQSIGNSYVNGLQDYLNSAAYPGTLPTVAQLTQLQQYEDLEDTASQKLATVRTAAIAAWKADSVAQAAKTPFDTWVVTNYPSYKTAQNNLANAEAIVDAYSRQINSPAAVTLDSQISTLANEAFSPNVPFTGYNMPVFLGNNPYPLTPFQVNQITDPSQLTYRPLYTIPNYETVCDAWLQNKVSGIFSATLNLASVSATNWTDLGHTTSITPGSVVFPSLFSASIGTTSTSLSSFSSNFTGTVNLTLSMTGSPQVFSLNAGYWDVPNAQTAYPTLRTGTTNSLAGQIRIQKVLIGYGVGLTASFQDSTVYSTVQQYIKTASAIPNAGVNIFGFNFGINPTGGYTRNISSITLSQSGSTGFINLAPTPAGIFVLLGAYGTKL